MTLVSSLQKPLLHIVAVVILLFLSATLFSEAVTPSSLITTPTQQQHRLPQEDQTTSCKTHTHPNPLAALFPSNATGVLNATLAIIPIPLTLANSLIPSGISILESAFRSLLPSFPEGYYPVLLQAALDHDIQLKFYDITLEDFSRIGFEFPFLDLAKDGYSSYRWAPEQLISADNEIAIDGSRAYGTKVERAEFETGCQAYGMLENGNMWFKGVSTSSDDDNAVGGDGKAEEGKLIELAMARLLASSFDTGSPYPLDFFRNITNQPTFAKQGGGCDNMIRFFDTAMSRGEFPPVAVRGRVRAVNIFPFAKEEELELDADSGLSGSDSPDDAGRLRKREWGWTDVYGVQVATPFIENNYLDCETMRGASTSLYEYGGLPYALWSGNQLKIIYSDARNKTVDVLSWNEKEGRWERQVLIKSETHRYGDFDCHPDTPWVLAVEEDHTKSKPEDVKNRVVLINIETGEVRQLGGSEQYDFVTYPRFNPTDVTNICHIHWNHPDMPFW
ncbi:hypothetical protein B0T20DRAFT_343709, partial [Sordaria brevicollis]